MPRHALIKRKDDTRCRVVYCQEDTEERDIKLLQELTECMIYSLTTSDGKPVDELGLEMLTAVLYLGDTYVRKMQRQDEMRKVRDEIERQQEEEYYKRKQQGLFQLCALFSF
ncbi:DgyrCDS12704 [Dimorphilus gyrociliatus]|uniref:DgyrCDS12704 n=1 Tax=Dimorphilus gyrociliatus TaxID=2664684 RepID=A0A7I8W8N2_9ANNE|nr:DgyrCDS12704 [Dimorphilus gyrociliatus]